MENHDERAQQNPFLTAPDQDQLATRTVPIIQAPTSQASAPSPGDPMEVTPPPTAMMAPPTRTSPEDDVNGIHENTGIGEQAHAAVMPGPNAAAAAAAGAQQPKVVQTAFIHKLYK